MVLEALKGVRPRQPIERSLIRLIRHSAGLLDWDNAFGGVKPLFDCLVSASARNPDGLALVRDDNPMAMPFPPHMTQVKCGRGEGRTEVLIYEL
jgi:hypothetical protein